MSIIDIPTERTTSATDLLLAVIALACLAWVLRKRRPDGYGRPLWAMVFALVILSATLGAVVHGLTMDERARFWLWQPLNLSLGLAVALFGAAAANDTLGRRWSDRFLPWALAAAATSFLFSFLYPASFLAFVVFEGAVMLFALAVYLLSALRKDHPGAWPGACGTALMILASAVQTLGSLRFTMFYPFDNNGAFHLIQMPAFLLLAAAATRPPRYRTEL